MSSWLGHSRTHKPPTAPKWSPGSWYNNNLHVINISVFLFWTLWGTLSRLWARMSEPSPDPHQLSTQTWKNSSRIWPLPDPLRKKKKIRKVEWGGKKWASVSLAGWHSSSSWQQNLTLFLFQARAGTRNEHVIGDPGWFGWVCVAENTLGKWTFWIIRLARYSLAASVREQEPRDVFRPRRCWFIS